MDSVRDNFAQGLEAAITVFTHKQPTLLLDHVQDCCMVAKEWFLAMNEGMRRTDDILEMPTWLQTYFRWGPSKWPLYWCDVMRREMLDCGTLAALSRESLNAQGIIAWPAQVIRLHSEDDVRHWRLVWEKEGCQADWMYGTYVYHEVIAVVQQESVQIWDPTENVWIAPELRLGYTSIVAIRIIRAQPVWPQEYMWGALNLLADSWKSILE